MKSENLESLLQDPVVTESQQRENAMLRWVPVLLGNTGFVFRVILAATLLGLVISLVLPVRYESQARLLPADSGGAGAKLLKTLGGMGDAAVMAGYFGADLGSDSDSGRFVGILRSRTVSDRLIDRFELMKVYGTGKREIARKTLAANTAITEERKTGQIVVRVADRNAERAAQLTQGYIDELNSLSAQLNTSAAHREREFLEQRLSEVEGELSTASNALSRFSQKNTMLAMGDQQKAMLESAARLQGEMIAARAQLSGLEQTYSDNNYRVRESRARVNKLSQELESLLGRNSGDNEQSAQPSAEAKLFPSIRDLPGLGVTYAQLYKRAKTLEIISELLTRQLELAKTEEAKELPVLRVLDKPEIPQSKSWPPRTLIVLCGILVGLLVATTWLVGRVMWQELEPDDTPKVLAAMFRDWSRSGGWTTSLEVKARRAD